MERSAVNRVVVGSNPTGGAVIYKCNDINIEDLSEYLKHDFAVIPADTLYALSIWVFSDKAEKIYEIKGRKKDVPVPVALSDFNNIQDYVYPHPLVEKIIKEDWGYLVTFVLKNKKIPYNLVGETVGIRFPKNEIIRKIVKKIGPITITSANKHGGKNPVNVLDAYSQLGETIKIYVDCGSCLGRPSTVIDLTSKKPRLIREGAVPFKKVMEIYGSE